MREATIIFKDSLILFAGTIITYCLFYELTMGAFWTIASLSIAIAFIKTYIVENREMNNKRVDEIERALRKSEKEKVGLQMRKLSMQMKVSDINSVEGLITFIDEGNELEWIFFWGHKEYANKITHACFSQWYPSPFEEDGITYKTAEHYMMAGKARLFNDDDALDKILECDSPAEAQRIGRAVKNFDVSIWDEHCRAIVTKGNILKFAQNPELKEYILSTENKILVEATTTDRIWGIGHFALSKEAKRPELWEGENRLGFCLMQAREALKSSL